MNTTNNIENAKNLKELYLMLNDLADEQIDDIRYTAKIPTFGGDDVDDHTVVSWDAENVLVMSDDEPGFDIVSRADFFGDCE
jgi:hypothetical protein